MSLEYRVLVAEEDFPDDVESLTATLVSAVNSAIGEGWEPLGGVVISSFTTHKFAGDAKSDGSVCVAQAVIRRR